LEIKDPWEKNIEKPDKKKLMVLQL
jgi:hypothetical protein